MTAATVDTAQYEAYKKWEWNPLFLADLEAVKDNATVLADRLNKRLAFGTAGLRAAMGAGFNRMNDLTVLQTTQGLAEYLVKKFGAEGLKRGAIIGYDGRHNSKRFAHVTAAAFLARGFRVRLNSKVTATPMNPFAVVRYGAVIGIQITASHNPKNDNGYKVYADNGAQIVPPMDADVAEEILRNLEPNPDALKLLDLKGSGLLLAAPEDPYDQILEAYMSSVPKELVPDCHAIEKTNLRVVYTAMHGVGYPFIEEVLKRVKFNVTENLVVVPEQQWPDPEFTTVAFPNPEEKGALNLAQALADKHGISIVIANDPDADRFACAEKQKDGKWKIFHGDEIGILFGATRFEALKQQGVKPEEMFFICSAVSSRMLQKLAESEGAHFEDTMTGFKWMMNAAIPLHNQGKKIGLVYEEALGYALSMACPDKDGISATAVWIDMCARLHAEGLSIGEKLDQLRQKYGYFLTNNSYLTCHSTSLFNDVFNKFRGNGSYPSKIGRFPLKRIRDVTTGYDNGMPDSKCTFPLTPTSQMVTLYYENGTVLTLRTSGTEPKLKWYAELSGSDPEKARNELAEVVDEMVEHLCQRPTQYSFTRI